MNEKKSTPADQPAGDKFHPSIHHPSVVSSFFAVSEKMASSNLLRFVIMALLPILILLTYPVNRFDYDMWWQMALGKYYLANHTIVIDHSIFSWTPSDPAWVYNTCLGSIVIYLFYNVMGGFGLWIFQWLIFLAIFLLFYLFLKLIGRKIDVTVVAVIAAIGIASAPSCSYYKPELFSALLFCAALFILFYIKLTHKKYFFYFYPLIFFLWVNLHGAFIIGLAMLVTFFTGELLNRKFFPEESLTIKELTHLGVASVLSFAAILLNPYGIHYLLSIARGIFSDNYDSNSRYIQAYVSLWPHLREIGISFFQLSQTAWIIFIMMFFLTCLFVYGLIKKKTCDFTLLFISMATFWGSMRAVRAAYFFAILFFFTFFYLLNRLKLKDISSKAIILSLIVFIIFLINIFSFTFRYNADNRWFGAGLDDSVPIKETAFLKKYKPVGPLFNDYLVGAYLIWALYPDYKVFIDPRLVPYHRQVAPDYWALVSKPAKAQDIMRFNEKYPFKTAILHYSQLPMIFDFLNAGWRLLYFERNAAILVHPSLLSGIAPEIQSVDLGPMRFKNEKNPLVLLNVFTLYVNLYPQASPVIYDLYRKNVSDWYKPKAEHLRVMERDMQQQKVFHAVQ
ncbi:MAG: hypothetical protein WBN66_05060 [Smithella sp.]